jgi:hypothetical protein
MRLFSTLFITTAILFSSCNTSGGGSGDSPLDAPSDAAAPKTPAQLKEELAYQEKAAPLDYMIVDGTIEADEIQTRREGMFHNAEYSPDGNTIHGTIKNLATMAKYKDVVIVVTYYSQTDTKIKSEEKVYYEFYPPNSTTSFDLKVYPPKEMAKFGLEIKSATAAD